MTSQQKLFRLAELERRAFTGYLELLEWHNLRNWVLNTPEMLQVYRLIFSGESRGSNDADFHKEITKVGFRPVREAEL